MVRSALASKGVAIGRGPRVGADYIPAITVVAASFVSLFPIVSTTGWWPDAGLLMLVAWRLLRADAWPAWWAAPLGLVNDLVVGNPIGLSVALWPLLMIAMDILDRRTMWRDYWIEWAIAALFIGFAEVVQWRVEAWSGAPVPLATSVAPAILVSVLIFPLAAFLAARFDRWRLGR